jgi:hypothetical protein
MLITPGLVRDKKLTYDKNSLSSRLCNCGLRSESHVKYRTFSFSSTPISSTLFPYTL